MFFAKLIRIITGIIIVWLIFHFIKQLGRKKARPHKVKQDYNNHKHRKFVESHVVESSSQNDKEVDELC